MEQLIPIASKLQDVQGALGQSTTLDLPQIVVVGGQSSGKSSVLEGVVGRSFLPRGNGIVTRRPLILQLHNTGGPGGGLDSHDGNGDGDGDGEGDGEGDGDGDGDSDEGAEEGGSDYDDAEEEAKKEEDEEGGAGLRRIRGGRGRARAETSASSSVSSRARRGRGHGRGRDGTADIGARDGGDERHDEWGEFLHLPGRRFVSFSQIRTEIVRDTDRLTGTNRGINPTPIHLKIYSPRVLNLTMVDLPGIAKVAVGDQPHDIEEQVRDMCLRYISNPNAIILAVSAANTDLANSDALQLARAVDPNGDRTVGVLTKLDLMDPGTDASDMLLNRVVPLRRGYVGVVNRGQRDVDADLAIQDGLRKELEFFRSHPVYGHDRAIASRVGTANLTRMLNSILMHHIRECLPELKSRIGRMLADVQGELDALGSTVANQSRSTLGAALLGLLSRFAANFASTVDGRGTAVMSSAGGGGGGHGGGRDAAAAAAAGSVGSIPFAGLTPTTPAGGVGGIGGGTANAVGMDELYGGARISYIFTAVFAHSLTSVGPFDGLDDTEIRTTICNANGTRPALFVPEISFDILVRRQIARLEQPGLQCVDLVYEELQRIASQSEPPELTRFPSLRERLVEVVSGLLRRAVGPTQLMVSNLVKIELAYINTSHPDFIGGSKAVARLMERMGREQRGEGGRRHSDRPRGGGAGAGRSAGRGGGAGGGMMAGDASMNGGDVSVRRGGALPSGSAAAADRVDVGATPLSSSSLDNYINGTIGDDENLASVSSRFPPVGASEEVVSTSATGGGGIMNLIFRGGGGSVRTPNVRVGGGPDAYRTPGGRVNPGHYHQQHHHGGPPSIVQLPQVPSTMRQTDVPPTDRERVEVEIIKSLIDSYFGIVRKNFIDMVPKTVMHFLVNHVRDAMQNELVAELYRDAEVPGLMKEADDVAQRRETCVEMRDLLGRALEIVNEVRDFNTFK